MSSVRSFFIPLVPCFILAGTTGAQTVPATTSAPPAASPVQHLEKFVVSAGPDPKSELDLAQGTAVLTGDDLRRQVQATLGDTLAGTPGVSATSYGPGASRPIIRGLGGDRVRVLDNGIGSLDVSNISPDHQTALEPLFASSIEVLRGPSAILYGSSAVGGVVNFIDNTIPDTAPDGSAHGNLEVRGATATHERTALLSLGGGEQAFGVHVNALKRKTDNIRIPDVARIDADAPADQRRGILPDSDTDTSSFAGGATLFWGAGHAGAGITHYETEYGVPTDEPGTIIRMRQTRYDFAGTVTKPFGIFRSAKGRLGLSDYTHSELGDRGAELHTTFNNKAAEGRIELAHEAIGNVTGTIGAQGTRSDFSAVGEEAVTPPSLTYTGALFALEEAKLNPTTTLQVGGRLEYQTNRLGEVDPDLPDVAGYSARSRQTKKFVAPGASVGVVVRPERDWSFGASIAYTERPPTPQELFSNGPHGGTGTYEVGSTGLGNEKSLGFDLNVKRRVGFVTGTLSGFVNRFSDYIFERDLPASAIPGDRNPDGLRPFQFAARDARFYGGEASVEFHLLDRETQHVHLELMADYVHAENTADDEPLPRIPPLHYGARVEYEDGRWHADAEARRTDRQTRVAPGETETAGYTMVNASVSYEIPAGRVSYELFARGTNLTDVTAREHTSFLKEFAPSPGRGVLAGVRMTF
jgi:iron complex outermembrane receptor protein